MMVIYAIIFFVAILLPLSWWNLRSDRIAKEKKRINKKMSTVFGLSIQNDKDHDYQNL